MVELDNILRQGEEQRQALLTAIHDGVDQSGEPLEIMNGEFVVETFPTFGDFSAWILTCLQDPARYDALLARVTTPPVP
jgi:hypothetical protein